jgi:hypothetical protein
MLLVNNRNIVDEIIIPANLNLIAFIRSSVWFAGSNLYDLKGNKGCHLTKPCFDLKKAGLSKQKGNYPTESFFLKVSATKAKNGVIDKCADVFPEPLSPFCNK